MQYSKSIKKQVKSSNSFLYILSPIALIAICAGIQFLAGYFIGVWAWVPTMFCFWLIIAFFLHKHTGISQALKRFKPASGAWLWSALAVLAGLLSLFGFIQNWTLLSSPLLVIAWLAFALINPWFEESYWRGLLIDSTAKWGKTGSLLYSSLWFAASHPLIWGIHATSFHKIETVAAVFFVGIIWGLVYQRTKSLRWCVVGHILANLLGLATLILLNLYDPTAM